MKHLNRKGRGGGALLLLWLAAACADPPEPVEDAGVPDAAAMDAGEMDAGVAPRDGGVVEVRVTLDEARLTGGSGAASGRYSLRGRIGAAMPPARSDQYELRGRFVPLGH